jgi:glycosyltransferase involved in cell wall biosynthesis
LPVKLLRNQQNLGIVASLNRGIDVAQGRYIARMDADDICFPHRFARQIDFLERTGHDVCGSWFIEFGQGIPRTVRWPHTDAALRAAMLFQNSICHPTIMARREVFDQFRYREGYKLAEDYDLFVRAMTRFRFANVPEPLLRYRRHPQQATQAARAAMEMVTRRIRREALEQHGIEPSEEELRLHQLIRSPSSIVDIADLMGIEAWLIKLHQSYADPEGRQVIASQWIRACIRAAPLGQAMWRAFEASALLRSTSVSKGTWLDLRALSVLKLDYSSRPFAALRRIGLSA